MDGKSLTNNSLNTSHGRGRGKGKGQGRNRDQERDKGRGDRQSKGNSKGRGRNQSNTTKSRGRGNSQKRWGNAGKRQDGEKSKEKTQVKWKKGTCSYCDTPGHFNRDCQKRIADETKTTATTNSSQQLTIEDDLDVLFQNTLYVHSDGEAYDDETMEEEVVYDFTNNLPQETHNSDTVPTAQNPEIQVQTNAEITIEAEKTPLTFEEQDETEIALNAHDSFGDYGKEKGQEVIPPHGSFSAHPELGATHTSLTQTESEEVSKQPEERQKHAKTSRKRGVSHKADNNLTVKKPGNRQPITKKCRK